MIFNIVLPHGGSALKQIFIDGVAVSLESASSTAKYKVAVSGKNWELAFLQSCLVRFPKTASIDVFAVGGGGGGGQGQVDSNNYSRGGGGGCGGYNVTQKAFSASGTVAVTIGAGHNPVTSNTEVFADSSLFGTIEAKGGVCGASSTSNQSADRTSGTGAGGRGASNSGGTASHTANAGGEGVLAFGGEDCLTFPAVKFGAGGGGGGARRNTSSAQARGLGGATDGGNGGQYTQNQGYSSNYTEGTAGKANYGSGGGGGGAIYTSSMSADFRKGTKPGYKGGSGIVIIRNAR